MLILGFQKMTLLDYPGKVACTVFTGGCNLRCPFCHNASLVTEVSSAEEYPAKDITDFLKTRTKLLDGVCITGGEPLLQKDIKDFIKEIKSMGYSLKLDTNGCYPDALEELVSENLVDYVAMDVKNAFPYYAETVGIKDLDLSPIKRSIKFLLSGKVAFEFRTTVVKEFHDVSRIEKLAEEIAGAPRYFLQNFVDSGNLIESGLHAAEREELGKMAAAARKYVKEVGIRGI